MRTEPTIAVASRLARLVAAAALAGMAACGDGREAPRDASAAPAAPAADYDTHTDHFAALQRAALSADYAGFAQHLSAADPSPVVRELRRSFRGRPFDVYTAKAEAGAAAHRRTVELRNTTGRLYLYLQLARVPGGWSVTSYDLGRDRGAILGRL